MIFDVDPLTEGELKILRESADLWPSAMCGPSFAVKRLLATIADRDARIDALNKELYDAHCQHDAVLAV